MRRTLSAILSLAMVLSLFTFLGVMNVAAEVIAISNASPAITANVGDTVDFSNYSVVFDGDSSATANLTWKNEAGTKITTLKIQEKGVVPVTATSGSKSKTIYVVSKEKNETEYVLFEVDFSKYSNISQLQNEGWTFLNSSDRYAFKDGTFVLGNIKDDYARVILPSWLGNFGDYAISTDLKMLTTSDTGRWVGVVYRIQNANGKYYPYYHLCARENTTSGGIEFTERTTSNGWNVVLKSSGEISSLKNKYQNFTVRAKGKKISHEIDGEQVAYLTEDVISTSKTGVSAASYEKGQIGLTMNYGTVAFKNLKVTVQETVPAKAERKLDLINNAREEINLINPVANVEQVTKAADLAATPAGSVFVRTNSSFDFATFVKGCVDNKKLATYFINDKATAEKFVTAMKNNKCKDANVISSDKNVLAYIREEILTVRTGLFINKKMEYHDIRKAVRSAPATFVAYEGTSLLSKEDVMEIQEYAVAVWVILDENATNLDIVKTITYGVNGIITANAANTAALINKHFVEDSMTRTPIIIGHRGNPSQAPENTLSGFIKAYENGADVFEVDVEITKDGHVIIMHDSTINRTTTYTGSKNVNQMTLAEIKAEFILGKDGKATTEKVPTLKEVCDYFADKDCKIFVEFKGSNANNVPATLKLLQEYDMAFLVDVISFNGNFLTQTQKEYPGMSTGFLVSGSDNGKTPEDALNSIYSYLVKAQGANSTINPASGIVSSKGNYATKVVTDRGITIWPWTYNYGSNTVGFFSGCDGVTTDDAQWARNMAKYLKAPENVSIAVGQQLVAGATVVEYGNAEYVADGASTVASVIEGEDVATIVNGKLVGLKEGKATVILGYRASTPTGGVYYVYTEPFEVTVKNDKNALKDVIDAAKAAKRTNYIPEIYEKLVEALADAEAVYSNASASSNDIANACALLSELVNSVISKDAASLGADYTATAPNRNDVYDDDGKRLTDGAKGSINGSAYAGWNNTPVEVVVDLGELKDVNTFTVYSAFGFWGISELKSVNIQISADGKTYTDLGAATKIYKGTNGTADSATVKLNEHTIVTEDIKNIRYVKYTMTPSGNFVWIDEVEATLSSGVVFTLGDVNDNGEIEKYDYIAVKRAVMGTLTLNDVQKLAADVNGKDGVEKYDYILIKRHVMGTYKIGQ
jgi:glycerophosphoryl diester phosphodiesterase